MKKFTKSELINISNSAKYIRDQAEKKGNLMVSLGPQWIDIIVKLCSMAKKDCRISTSKIKKK